AGSGLDSDPAGEVAGGRADDARAQVCGVRVGPCGVRLDGAERSGLDRVTRGERLPGRDLGLVHQADRMDGHLAVLDLAERGDADDLLRGDRSGSDGAVAGDLDELLRRDGSGADVRVRLARYR